MIFLLTRYKGMFICLYNDIIIVNADNQITILQLFTEADFESRAETHRNHL